MSSDKNKRALVARPGYDVGYGKPPKDTRFKPGQSGNPKGRPRGSKNKRPGLHEERMKDLILDEAYRDITIREGHRSVTLPMAQAVIRSLAVNAANPSERTESGLLNYGTDTDDATNPFEVRMGKFIDLDISDDVIGVAALRKIKASGVKRHQLGIVLEGGEESEDQSIWLEISKDDAVIGHMTHKAWSYRLKRMIGYALVSVDAQAGDVVRVMNDGQPVAGQLTEVPFKIPG